jgi:hypothetical protein
LEKEKAMKNQDTEKASYARKLSRGELEGNRKALIKEATKYFGVRGLKLDQEIVSKCPSAKRIRHLYVAQCTGNRSWQGLVVGFPGSKDDLSTYSVSTPYIREVLFSILACYQWTFSGPKDKAPCLYILGEQFSDVWFRKFRFFNYIIPNVIVLPETLKNSAVPGKSHNGEKAEDPRNESYYQRELVTLMSQKAGATFQTSSGQKVSLKYLGREVFTGEGTEDPERLDLLAYDLNDGALVAFEIKGPEAKKSQMENLFFQGMDHRDWLEKNKMAIKFVFDDGPRGRKVNTRKVNTRKRVKMVLGYCKDWALDKLKEFAKIAKYNDSHLELLFCDLNKLKEGEKILTLDRVNDR